MILSLYCSIEVKRATLTSSLRFLRLFLKKMEIAITIPLNDIFTLYLLSIRLFDDLSADFIKHSIQDVCSILEGRIKLTHTSPFGAAKSTWWKRDMESEIMVYQRIG